MSIFDFLFARGATPEQRNKNIFLDAIDGGGRFGSGDDFKGGPLGISALLNALGVDPYGYSNAQPSSPPPRTAPVGKPAQQSAPRPASPLNLVDFITANNNLGLSPSTDAELTEAFDQPIPVSPTARPFDGAGFGYTVPPPAPQMGTSFGDLGNPVDMNRDLGLLAPQVVQEATAAQPVDYLATAMQYPEFQRYVDAMAHRNLTREQLAQQFLNIAESTASSVSASPLAMSAAPASLSSSSIRTSGSLPVLSNDYPTNTSEPFALNTNAPSPQGYYMPTVVNDSPTYANPSPHPESEIQRFMSEYGLSRQGAIGALNISLRAYEAQKEMMELQK